jgi:hypothetical protein
MFFHKICGELKAYQIERRSYGKPKLPVERNLNSYIWPTSEMSREQAKATIEKLVERYKEHQREYHLADYNEQKTRQDFINPFFKALCAQRRKNKPVGV